MLKDIVEVTPLARHRLRIRFEDGVEGVIDVSAIVEFSGVFEPLEDQDYFAAAFVNPDWGTVTWPNGADLDPDVLYSRLTGESLADFEVVSFSESQP
jgi:hypothetical protein